MAWTCSGRSNVELIENLAREGIISTNERILQAFKSVDRAHYVTNLRDAYVDSPSYIGSGATISAPHMHAHAVENLEPFLKAGANVLDVGCGSGYLLGIFHSMVAPTGSVLGIEHLPSLVSLSNRNISKAPEGSALAKTLKANPKPSVRVILADGRKGSPESETPSSGWDAIHVGAAAPTIPEALVKQLAKPGRMFIPVGTSSQAIWQVDKDKEGKVSVKKLFGVRYVPLTDAALQAPGEM